MKKYVKRFIPQTTRTRLKNIKRHLDYLLLQLIVRSRLTSTLYYAFMSSAFWREHQAVAAGRLKFEQDYYAAAGSQYLLRRNIHRLEKGLIMKPRRPIFALEYISETVRSFSQHVATRSQMNGEADREELQWAADVLASYFAMAGSHPVIDAARREFDTINHKTAVVPAPLAERAKSPYKRDLERPIPVAYDALLELAYRRRSVRWFLPHRVPRELLDKAVTLAALSPSACNRQPFLFHIFDGEDEKKVQQVAELALGTAGFNHNFPALVVIVGRQRAYFSERDRHIIYIDGALAAMSFVLALETVGLSSCCINWPDIEAQERKMAKLLNLALDERVVMLIAVGYPDPNEPVPYSAKKMLHTIRRYN
jgi:nitroreductase